MKFPSRVGPELTAISTSSRTDFDALCARRDGLRAILLDWDPIGTQDEDSPGPADEYDCLLTPLIGALCQGADVGAVAQTLDGELEHHFGLPPSTDTTEIASRIVHWYEAQ